MTLKDDEKLVFFEGLSNLLSSGIPIIEAISGFEEDSSKKLRVILVSLRENLQRGKTIHESLALYPQIFDGVTLSLIQAGEESGSLDAVFETITKNLAEDISFKNKIKNALVYPAVLFVVFLIMLVFIMIYAVPKFKYVFSRLSAQIPAPTRVIFFISDAILNYYPYILVGIVAILLTLWLLIKKFKAQLHQVIAVLPIVTNLYNYLDIYRFSKTLSLLITAGIPITNALELCRTTVFKKSNIKRLTQLTTHAETGRDISLFLNSQKGFMPKTMINLVEFGEKSGTLDKSFSKISNLAQLKVQTALDRIAVLMEPLVITIMGVTVGGVMMSIIAPIYQLIGNLNVR